VLTVQLDGDPTPKSTATVDDVTPFVVGEYAQFYDASNAVLGYALIVSILGQVITFTTDSLTWDAEVGDAVMPALRLDASRPQPVGPEAIDFLEEGARTTARYIIYVDDVQIDGSDSPELYSTRDGYSADTMLYNSKTYKVTADDDYHEAGDLGYQSYIILEYAEDERAPVP
jgi:hypothetical protein